MEPKCEVVELGWERVLLTIDVDWSGEQDPGFFLEPTDETASQPLSVVSSEIEPGRYRLTINVTTFHDRSAVSDGEWRLVAHAGGAAVPARFDLGRVAEFDDLSRAFVYGLGHQAYTVTFGVVDSDETPDFLMRTYGFSNARGNGGAKQRAVAAARGAWRRGKRAALRGVFKTARRFGAHDGSRLLFASEARPSMQGNLKQVHDRMRERGLHERFTFDTSFRTVQTTSRISAFQLGWKLGKADIVLTDDYFPLLADLIDGDRQKIIQLWHAGVGFKLVGLSRFGQHGSSELNDAHRKYTFAICGSEHLRDVYSEVFGIEREAVIPTGLPRIDAFLAEGGEDRVRPVFDAAFPAARGKRKILFAPTFRGSGADRAFYGYDTMDFEALYEACGEHSVVLFRQHHFIADPAPIPDHLRDRLIDAASFPDTNDLLLVSDVLVTDYSSIIYEYSLLRRPMLFYAYDLDLYTAVRGMHRDYREMAPGEIAETFDRLLELISQPTLSTEKTEAFVSENFDHVDTHNADRVIDQLILGDPRDRAATA